jgi:hypothetical protein
MEQFSRSQAVIENPEQASWRELLEGFSRLVSDYIEANRNFSMDFIEKKTVKHVENLI